MKLNGGLKNLLYGSDANGAWLTGLLLIAFVWTSAAIWWNPQTTRNDAFIFRDASHVLVVADDLLSGRALYRDVFYAYGPIAAYTHTFAAGVFGNSPVTLLCLQQAFSLAVVALAYQVVRSTLSGFSAGCFLVVAAFPFILIPGSSLADFSGLDYVSLERIGILLIAFFWRPPNERTIWHGVVLGLLLGLLQGVKFGGAFVAGAALLAADLFYSTAILRDRTSRLSWLKVNLSILFTFCIIEAGWAAIAFLVLPRDVAIDALWPRHMLDSYKWYVGATDRWPGWHNLGYFVTAQFSFLSCFVLLVIGIIAAVKSRRTTSHPEETIGEGKAVFLAAFFFIGSAIYFRHVWHFTQYGWTLVLAACAGFHCLRISLRAALLILWFPTLAASGRACLWPSGPLQTRETFPSGDSLWIESARRDQLTKLHTTLALQNEDADAGRSVIFFPEGGGLHHFWRVSHASRYFWFMGGLIQKRDADEFVRSVSESKAIVVFFRHPQANPPDRDPNSWLRKVALTPNFEADVSDRIRSLLDVPIMVDQYCWVFPVRQRTPSNG